MFKVTEIKELIRAIDRSTIGELTIKGENNAQLTICKSNVGQAVLMTEPEVLVRESVETPKVDVKPVHTPEKIEVAAEMNENPALHTIKAPLVGTFYTAPSPDSPPFVKVGDQVEEGSILCIVEAMKLMNELEADINGEIVDILVENGQLVEYGMPLFLVKPA